MHSRTAPGLQTCIQLTELNRSAVNSPLAALAYPNHTIYVPFKASGVVLEVVLCHDDVPHLD